MYCLSLSLSYEVIACTLKNSNSGAVCTGHSQSRLIRVGWTKMSVLCTPALRTVLLTQVKVRAFVVNVPKFRVRGRNDAGLLGTASVRSLRVKGTGAFSINRLINIGLTSSYVGNKSLRFTFSNVHSKK